MRLKLMVTLTLLLFIAPLLVGFGGVIAPAFSWLPVLGLQQLSFNGWLQMLAWPGLSHSLLLTLFTGLGSTLLALCWCFIILKQCWHSQYWFKIERLLVPVLAMPHVAFVLGLVLTFSANGWLARILHHLGFSQHLYPSVIHDSYGIGLLLTLAIKETPFLLLMSMAVLQQLNIKQLQQVAASLGYNPQQTWFRLILPLWLPKLRLAIYAVTGYSLAVVDVALIIGPNQPSTFAVLVWQWFNEPNLELLPRAAAGAMLLLLLTAAIIILLRFIEWLLISYCNQWQYRGVTANVKIHNKTGSNHRIAIKLSQALLLFPLLMLPTLAIWSVAQRWRFPDLFPSRYSWRFWQQQLEPLQSLMTNSLILALISSLSAIILAIVCLEYRQKYQRGLSPWLITVPMIAPQISLLFGMQTLIYTLPGQHYWLWLSWSHWLYVFPYVYLALDGAWRSYDVRLDQTARSLA
ncbi:ABC transporter permease [Shewanella marina]|uniref:ABC transporter permease n=1 Tax=Shewanella marina TaxID=487319 RepID=UPI0019012FFC|nr:thiamine ABC transporter permease [Shewanella marina]